MPLVSIITPVLPRADDHLRAAYRSLADQVLPAGWEWEWLVHIDGGGIPGWLADLADPRVHVSADPHHHGAALARNLLVSRSAGSHLKVLDADDQLTPGALARDLEVVRDHPEVAWVTSRARDLLDDGTLVEFDDAPAPGVVATGDVYRAWIAHDFRSSIHPATLLAERRRRARARRVDGRADVRGHRAAPRAELPRAGLVPRRGRAHLPEVVEPADQPGPPPIGRAQPPAPRVHPAALRAAAPQLTAPRGRARMDGMRRYVWMKDDPVGMEQAELAIGDGLVATSVAFGSAPVPYRLDLELTTDAAWVTRRLALDRHR